MLGVIEILLSLVAFVAVLAEAGITIKPLVPPSPLYKKDEVDKLAAKGLAKLALYKALHPSKNKCTIANAVKRKEWSDLPKKDRIAYIDAVLCLQAKPSITPASFAPGARSRFDDFVVTHINQTTSIHSTGNFLAWHRYYVHAYEKALRKECGYKGYQPYWNWGRYAADPKNSPLFDGSPSSMSGNGLFVDYPGVTIPRATPGFNDIIPSAGGGGCVTTGPFKNMTVNLGPRVVAVPNVPTNPLASGLGYNPRCLRRDINPYSAAVTTDNYTSSLITSPGNKDIYWFQTNMQGRFELGRWGVHTGGHFTVGGDPGGDFYTSSGDPNFYLHHGQIDRVWWIWQNLNLPYSLSAVSGTITQRNIPPSRNATLEDIVDLGLNAPAKKLGSLLDTMEGDFCYIYV